MHRWLALGLVACEVSTSHESSVDQGPAPAVARPSEPSEAEEILHRDALLAASALRPGMHVADIGANHGWFVDRGALAIGPSGMLYATDIDADVLRSLERLAAITNPARAPIVVRRAGERATGLDDLPEATLDVIWMIDSLCFESPAMHEQDVAYLHAFLRLLKPGGRLLHHMDCDCRVSPDAVVELFEAAGFANHSQTLVTPTPAACSSPEQRERYGWLAIFAKPG